MKERAFDSPGAEAEYWLGLLLADGYVTKKTVSLSLQESDRKLVEKFRGFLESKPPVRIRDGMAIVNICSKALLQDLYSWGVYPNKTHSVKPPKELREYNHFWRGVIDGDGCLGFDTRGYPYIGLAGTLETVTAFLTYAQGLTNTSASPGFIKGTTYQTQIKGAPSVPVVQELYADAPISLTRKQKVAEKIFGYDCSPKYPKTEDHPNSKLTIKQVKEIWSRLENETQVELAEEYGVSKTTICDLANGRTYSSVTKNL